MKEEERTKRVPFCKKRGPRGRRGKVLRSKFAKKRGSGQIPRSAKAIPQAGPPDMQAAPGAQGSPKKRGGKISKETVEKKTQGGLRKPQLGGDVPQWTRRSQKKEYLLGSSNGASKEEAPKRYSVGTGAKKSLAQALWRS